MYTILTQKDSAGNTYYTYCDGQSTFGCRHIQMDYKGRVVYDSEASKPKMIEPIVVRAEDIEYS